MKKSKRVYKSLPLDCWCHVIEFLSDSTDFLNLIFSIKGLQRNVQDIYPYCTKNIVFFFRFKLLKEEKNDYRSNCRHNVASKIFPRRFTNPQRHVLNLSLFSIVTIDEPNPRRIILTKEEKAEDMRGKDCNILGDIFLNVRTQFENLRKFRIQLEKSSKELTTSKMNKLFSYPSLKKLELIGDASDGSFCIDCCNDLNIDRFEHFFPNITTLTVKGCKIRRRSRMSEMMQFSLNVSESCPKNFEFLSLTNVNLQTSLEPFRNHLKELYFDNVILEKNDEDFFGYNNLVVLCLRNFSISTIKRLHSLPELKYLNLSHDRFVMDFSLFTRRFQIPLSFEISGFQKLEKIEFGIKRRMKSIFDEKSNDTINDGGEGGRRISCCVHRENDEMEFTNLPNLRQIIMKDVSSSVNFEYTPFLELINFQNCHSFGMNSPTSSLESSSLPSRFGNEKHRRLNFSSNSTLKTINVLETSVFLNTKNAISRNIFHLKNTLQVFVCRSQNLDRSGVNGTFGNDGAPLFFVGFSLLRSICTTYFTIGSVIDCPLLESLFILPCEDLILSELPKLNEISADLGKCENTVNNFVKQISEIRSDDQVDHVPLRIVSFHSLGSNTTLILNPNFLNKVRSVVISGCFSSLLVDGDSDSSSNFKSLVIVHSGNRVVVRNLRSLNRLALGDSFIPHIHLENLPKLKSLRIKSIGNKEPTYGDIMSSIILINNLQLCSKLIVNDIFSWYKRIDIRGTIIKKLNIAFMKIHRPKSSRLKRYFQFFRDQPALKISTLDVCDQRFPYLEEIVINDSSRVHEAIDHVRIMKIRLKGELKNLKNIKIQGELHQYNPVFVLPSYDFLKNCKAMVEASFKYIGCYQAKSSLKAYFDNFKKNMKEKKRRDSND